MSVGSLGTNIASQQIHGSSGASVECIDSVGNIIYENGRASESLRGSGFLLGGNAGASDLRIHDNLSFTHLNCDQFPRHDGVRPAYLIAPTGLNFINNYMKGCDAIDYIN